MILSIPLVSQGFRALFWWAASLLITHFTDKVLTKDRIDRVKNLIVDLAGREIDKTIKHQTAAELIRSFVPDMADTLIDWTIRTILWAGRLVGDIRAEKSA